METVYDACGGADALLRLAAAWHRLVLADPVVSHAFEHGYHPDHAERLAAYWGQVLGGPARYSEQLGDESAVVRMHSGEGDHTEMDQRALTCFDQALVDADLPEGSVRQALHDYFAWALTQFTQYPESADDVPADLPFPRWTWDGPIVG